VQWVVWNACSQKDSHRSKGASPSDAASHGTPSLQNGQPWHLQYGQCAVHCFGLHHPSHCALLESPFIFDLQAHMAHPLHLHSLQWSVRCLGAQKSWHSSTSESHTPMGASEAHAAPRGEAGACSSAEEAQNPQPLHLQSLQCSVGKAALQNASQRSCFESLSMAGVHALPSRQKGHAWHLQSEQCSS